MVRYTHFESDDASALVADGHRVRYLGTGDCMGGNAATAQTACDGGVEWIVVAAQWCCAVLFFGLAGICRLVLRSLVVVASALLLPLVYELVCLGGAVLLYPLGVVGRWGASAVEHAGIALSERSLALITGRRVLGALRAQPRAELSAAAPKSTVLAMRGCDRAEVER
jgi:hypothetical protein